MRYHTETWDIGRTTQNYGVWVEGEHGGSTCDFYGVVTQILEVSYILDHKVALFKCDWYDTDTKKKRIHQQYHITSINVSSKWYKDEPFILPDQSNQVLYLQDCKFGTKWRMVDKVNHRHLWDVPEIILESVGAQEDSNSCIEAYQEERSNDIDIAFDDTNVEILLHHENTKMIEINSSDINLEINSSDQILNETNAKKSDNDEEGNYETDVEDIIEELQQRECSNIDETDKSS